MIAGFGAVISIASVCLALNATGMRWLMGYLESASFVTHLAIMLMPVVFLTQVISSLNSVIMPAASSYEATRNYVMLRVLLVRGMRYTMFVEVTLLIFAYFLMDEALTLWVGSSYDFLAPYALALLVGGAFMLSTSTAHHVLKGINNLRAVTVSYFFGLVFAAFTTTLFLFLVSGDSYLSVTIGLGAGYLVCGVLQIFFSAKVLDVSCSYILVQVYIQPLLAPVLLVIVWMLIGGPQALDGVMDKVCAAIIACSLYLALCYWLFLAPTEKSMLSNMLQLRGKKWSIFGADK